jgi:hypothetical protein
MPQTAHTELEAVTRAVILASTMGKRDVRIGQPGSGKASQSGQERSRPT